MVKEIFGFKDYFITDGGEVISKKWGKIKILRPVNNKKGYLSVRLSMNGKPIRKFIHRLVAEHFVEGYEEGLVVNHKDGNKTNNHYSNLEWCTLSENSKHSFFNGLSKLPYASGESNGFSKLKNEDVLKMRELYKNGSSIEDLNLKFNICKRHIRDIVSGKRWSHLN